MSVGNQADGCEFPNQCTECISLGWKMCVWSHLFYKANELHLYRTEFICTSGGKNCLHYSVFYSTHLSYSVYNTYSKTRATPEALLDNS